jgi:murein DD-endopeptidase MepM/ murein hydrolase activator NlpD
MKYWPVPNSHSRTIPRCGSSGSFWENRGDRYHCGIDIYAPFGSDVYSIDDGTVIEIGQFTSPDILPYWNITYYILIRGKSELIFKYAELGDSIVRNKENIKSGQLLGHVGMVLNKEKVTQKTPKYIQNLIKKQYCSMLHLEVRNSLYEDNNEYLGGNWFGKNKPDTLLDPTTFLRNSPHTTR